MWVTWRSLCGGGLLGVDCVLIEGKCGVTVVACGMVGDD